MTSTPAAERLERFDNAPSVGAIGVAVRIEVGDGDSEEVWLGEEGRTSATSS
jgi:hypothetical protein